ncbi:MAG: hypothetical protein Ta2G_06680 [Termitinemataceae bacterium]|nr:MAG: hypothetical protein Ta2G_06680 [Termitinemataceae bacterium]
MNIEESKPVDESKITNGELTFYYSRERRLSRSPQAVRDLYDPTKYRAGGFFKSLTDTRAKSVTFIVIIVLCLAALLMTYVFPNVVTVIAGNKIAASAMQYEDKTFIVIKKVAKNKKAYSGIVDLKISSIDMANIDGTNIDVANVQNKKIFFTDDKTDEFRFSLPFNTSLILLTLQAQDRSLDMNINVK